MNICKSLSLLFVTIMSSFDPAPLRIQHILRMVSDMQAQAQVLFLTKGANGQKARSRSLNPPLCTIALNSVQGTIFKRCCIILWRNSDEFVMWRWRINRADAFMQHGWHAICASPICISKSLSSFSRLVRSNIVATFDIVPPFLAAVRHSQ